MKKFVLLFFIAFSTFANAEWKFVVNNQANTDRYYIDESTLKKKGEFFRAWFLVDYTEKNQFGNKSHKVLHEIDCEGRIRSIYYTFYEGNMGSGKVNTQFDADPKWFFATPGDINNALIKNVCRPRWN
jgi:hypothetical protein